MIGTVLSILSNQSLIVRILYSQIHFSESRYLGGGQDLTPGKLLTSRYCTMAIKCDPFLNFLSTKFELSEFD